MLDVQNVNFAYHSQAILRDIQFSVEPGEITAIIGPNGAGKSTLLKCLGGLLRPKGTIEIEGKALKSFSRKDRAALMSYLSQDHGTQAALNVFEVVLLGKIHSLSYKISDKEMEEVMSALRQFKLEALASRNIGELSGGQRQLVFIAQALVQNPRILLMDEPTSSLDLHHQFEMLELIQRLTVDNHLTTVMTLHHLDLAARYADKIIILHEGEVYDTGAPQDVFTTEMFQRVYKVNATITEAADGILHVIANGSTSTQHS